MEKTPAELVMNEPIIRVLISVYDKTNLLELIEGLKKFINSPLGRGKKVEVISTGATYEYLAEYLLSYDSNNKENSESSDENNENNANKDANNIVNIDNVRSQRKKEINKSDTKVNIKLQQVSEYIGFSEIFGGRVKTLHPKIHGGILANRELHQEEMLFHNIPNIDLVVVNLYPFLEYVKNNKSEAEIIENIDIGGVALLRAAAKNFKYVTVLSDPKDYKDFNFNCFNFPFLDQGEEQDFRLEYRKAMAKKAFNIVADYDSSISAWFTAKSDKPKETYTQDLSFKNFAQNIEGTEKIDKIGQGALENPHLVEETAGGALPDELLIKGKKQFLFRYGENPHQQAAFYSSTEGGLPFIQLQGKELSYNNILDSEAALRLVQEFEQPAAVIIKHNNPCGVALNSELLKAYKAALAADLTSAFGGIVAFNRIINKALAEELIKIFFEVIIAPGIDAEAKEILKTKTNLRVLLYNGTKKIDEAENLKIIINKSLQIRSAFNGFLVQQEDKELFEELQTVTKKIPFMAELEQLKFAWRVSKYVKSNAIVIAKDFQTLGIGAGQMNRINSVNIALQQAAKSLKPSNNPSKTAQEKPILVLASDAFFPFPDSIELAAKSNVTAIIQPGGSIKDKAVIEAADHYNIAMIFTKMRHFLH